MRASVRRWACPATLVLPWVALLVALPAIEALHNSFDLRVYAGATRSWLEGEGLYSFAQGDRRLGFTYPPFGGVLLLWTGALPLGVAKVLQQVLVVGAVLLAVRLLVARLDGLARYGPWTVAVALTPMLFALQPLRDTLSFGQVGSLVMLMVLVDLVLLGSGRRGAGIGVGLAAALKLTPALFVVFYLAAGRRRAAATAAGVFAAATLLAAAVDPGTSWSYWTEVLVDPSHVGSVDSATNQSLSGLTARLANTHPGAPPGTMLLLAVAAVVVVVAAARVARRGDLLGGFAVTGLGTCLVSPISWVHHLVWFVPALLWLADAGLRRRSRGLLVLVGLVLLTLLADPPDRFRAVTGAHLDSWGTVIGENAYVVLLVVVAVVLTRVGSRHPEVALA